MMQKKTSKTEKNKRCTYVEKHRMCTQKIRKCKYPQKITELQNTRIHSIWFWTKEMLLKFIIGNFFHVGSVS